jgi:NAD-dependent deacetylase
VISSQNSVAIGFAAALIREAGHAVAFTGAGISTPSGIPDFRSPSSGLWERYDPMEVASLRSFLNNPQRFYEWSRPLAEKILDAKPNPAHIALAKLEEHQHLAGVITQNIDGLHFLAGSTNVYEIHGHLRSATCVHCLKKVRRAELPIDDIDPLPRCGFCGGVLKPDIVLYGEELPEPIFRKARELIVQSDLVIIVGSSLEVYPVAHLPITALDVGANLIIINQEPTALDGKASVIIHEDAAVVLPRIAAEVLNEC